ncbi:hypothetical protein Ancab_029308 [Ancistrocladus abbreviatus]
MMTSYHVIIPILILFVSHGAAAPAPASQSHILGFLRCLLNRSHPEHPISQAIYTPENRAFFSVLQAYIRNLRFNTSSTPRPLAIIAALHESHVQATVICANANGLQIRIRSGGHDYEGVSSVSYVPFVILDMFNLRSVDIDWESETAWVQAGATLGELYYSIGNKSNTHAYPSGVCLTLGIGGHITGGGYGTMLRKFGLTVDRVIDAHIVNVNGKILNRTGMGEDLFWAIRGGGAASFCVILAWRISLVRVPEIVTVFKVPRTLEQGATDIVYQWQHVAPNITGDLFIRAQSTVPKERREINKTVMVTFYALYLGRTEALVELLKRSFPLLGLQKSDCIEMRWVESTLFFNELPKGTPLEILLQRIPKTERYDKHKSDYVKKAIPKEGLELIWKKMMEVETVTLQFNPYGGRMSQIPENATPFPHRAGNLFKIQYLASWHEGDLETISRNLNATDAVYDTMTPYVSKNPREAFLNYRDLEIGTNVGGSTGFAVDYFKSNLKRLLQVKTKVDPGNFFTYEQSIPALKI